jgi:hypothetical protein
MRRALKMHHLGDRDSKHDTDKLIDLISQHKPEVIAGFKPNTKSILMKVIQERVEIEG